MGFIILAIVIGGLLFAYYVSRSPKLTDQALKSVNSSLVYDGNNKLIADLGSEKRESVSADSIPLNLVNAITLSKINVSLNIEVSIFIVF